MSKLKKEGWELFCKLFIESYDKKKAALAAGYTSKNAGSKLYRNLEVRARISELMAEKFVEKKRDIKTQVLDEIIAIAFHRIEDFVRLRTVENVNMSTGVLEEKTIVEVLPTREMSDTRPIKSISSTPSGIKIEFHDKMRALDLLADITDIKNGTPLVGNINILVDGDDDKL